MLDIMDILDIVDLLDMPDINISLGLLVTAHSDGSEY